MRSHLAVLAGVGFILASACGDSGGSDGGSGTTGGTTGGSTTGGTTGGTSGGTGADAGNLAAGAACLGNTQCQSGVCDVNGVGNCCLAACDTTNATCGAKSCDNTGACVYPTTNCGASSCSMDVLTQPVCDGHGACALGSPGPCPNNFKCRGASACATNCTITAIDCVTGFFCETDGGVCLAPQATGPCATPEACTTNICGLTGTGNCCTTQCTATADPACDPTGCDATTGACTFPAGNLCGGSACTGNTLTAGACDATGACNTSTAPCANNLLCNPDGIGCLVACAGNADCTSGYYCSQTKCLPQVATGPCTTNSACTSGICGPHGVGHCCTVSCPAADPTCGSKDCDNTGACTFPNNRTACGQPAGCTGSTQTDPTTCDGVGKCQAQGTTDCSPYTCGPTACLATCKDNTSCVTGDFCDTGNRKCCSGLTNNGTITVDATNGSDSTACCGIGTAGACQTLTQAMALIDSAQAQNVTINASVGGAGGDWTSNEIYPVALGWGVELNAPGVFFYDAPGPNGKNRVATFDIKLYSANDTAGYASIVGSAKAPVGIGMDSANDQTDDVSAIQVEDKNKLFIANASVNGSIGNIHSQQAILLVAGATLTVGQDQSAGVTGTVQVGNALGSKATDGYQGIVCATDGVSGCTINDAALVGQSSLIIQGQHQTDLLADDLATINLTSSPVIGVPPKATGFKQCKQKSDGIGNIAVQVSGLSTVTFNNGTIQCIGGAGMQLQATKKGAPTVSIDSSLIQNTETGISALGGTVTVTNSTVNFNYVGVQQSDDGAGNSGSIDLSGGGNTVVCSSNGESSQSAKSPGISVSNASSGALKASNVAWDTSGPDYYDCDYPGFTSCTCNNTSCTVSAGSDGMDAVEDSTNKGGVTTTGNTLSSITCN